MHVKIREAPEFRSFDPPHKPMRQCCSYSHFTGEERGSDPVRVTEGCRRQPSWLEISSADNPRPWPLTLREFPFRPGSPPSTPFFLQRIVLGSKYSLNQPSHVLGPRNISCPCDYKMRPLASEFDLSLGNKTQADETGDTRQQRMTCSVVGSLPHLCSSYSSLKVYGSYYEIHAKGTLRFSGGEMHKL